MSHFVVLCVLFFVLPPSFAIFFQTGTAEQKKNERIVVPTNSIGLFTGCGAKTKKRQELGPQPNEECM